METLDEAVDVAGVETLDEAVEVFGVETLDEAVEGAAGVDTAEAGADVVFSGEDRSLSGLSLDCTLSDPLLADTESPGEAEPEAVSRSLWLQPGTLRASKAHRAATITI